MPKTVIITTGKCPTCGDTVDFDPAMFMDGHNFCDGGNYLSNERVPHDPVPFEPVETPETHYSFVITQTEMFVVPAKDAQSAYDTFINCKDNSEFYSHTDDRTITDEDGAECTVERD